MTHLQLETLSSKYIRVFLADIRPKQVLSRTRLVRDQLRVQSSLMTAAPKFRPFCLPSAPYCGVYGRSTLFSSRWESHE